MKEEIIQKVQEFRSLTSSLGQIKGNIEIYNGQIWGMETQKREIEKNIELQQQQAKEEKQKLSDLIDEINDSIIEEIKNLSEVSKKAGELEIRGFSSEDEQKELMNAFDVERAMYDTYNRIMEAYGQEKIVYPQRTFIYKPKELQAETLQKSI